MGGFNWAEGLKQAGAGMDTLGAAMEKTDELEYRNIRDKNLRRFKLEDQTREDRLAGEKREYDESIQAEKDVREDEKLGISPETERGEKILSKQEKDRLQKQDDSLERIRANIRKSSASEGLSKEAYIDRGMEQMKKLWDASIDITSAEDANRIMPAFERNMFRKSFAADWERLQEISGTGASTPFSPDEEKEAQDTSQLDPYDLGLEG